MTAALSDEVGDLLRTASRGWADDAATVEVLQSLERRMNEPLRVAVAGMVKAGKSTLLNALIGERLAPTDAGECTRVVTWYRYAVSPSVTLHPHDGPPRRMPVHRDDGRLVLDLGTSTAEDVAYIDVRWPATGLRSGILIDTPGIASLSAGVSERTAEFLLPQGHPASADAIVYLMRHVHSSDVKFLESFRDTVAGSSDTVNALAVLSRADEVGAGRIDSMLSARRVARRYESDDDLSSLALGVVPVAGLLAESARTLRESEFSAFRGLAGLERDVRDRLLLSTDRFVRPNDAVPVTIGMRSTLIARFGIYGVRLATALVRGGVADSSELAEALIEQSGLVDLRELLRLQFDTRAAALKARAVLGVMEQLARDRPGQTADRLLRAIERLTTSAHTLRELELVSRARSGAVPLPPADTAEAARIVGAHGTSTTARLAVGDDADGDAQSARLRELMVRWRRIGESPLADRATVDAARVVLRSLGQVASDLRAAIAGASDVVPAGGPREAPREGADEEGERAEGDLPEEHLP